MCVYVYIRAEESNTINSSYLKDSDTYHHEIGLSSENYVISSFLTWLMQNVDHPKLNKLLKF